MQMISKDDENDVIDHGKHCQCIKKRTKHVLTMILCRCPQRRISSKQQHQRIISKKFRSDDSCSLLSVTFLIQHVLLPLLLILLLLLLPTISNISYTVHSYVLPSSVITNTGLTMVPTMNRLFQQYPKQKQRQRTHHRLHQKPMNYFNQQQQFIHIRTSPTILQLYRTTTVKKPSSSSSSTTTTTISMNNDKNNDEKNNIVRQQTKQLLLQQPKIYRNIMRYIVSILSMINTKLNQSIVLQIGLLFILYIYHLIVGTQNVVILLYNTIAIGYDSLMGCTIFVFYVILSRLYNNNNNNNNNKNHNQQQLVPIQQQHTESHHPTMSSLSIATRYPWNLPRPQPEQLPKPVGIMQETETNIKPPAAISVVTNNTSSIDLRWIRFRISFIIACCALVKAYYQTGRYSLFWEDLLYTMSAKGWPITIPLSRSIQVLAGHLSWVSIGTGILWLLPRPPPFFGQQSVQVIVKTRSTSDDDDALHNNSTASNDSYYTPTTAIATTYKWFRMSLRNCNWLWWTIGGYYVSSWLFNVADMLNRYILPLQVLQEATESVVSQLVQPEHNDIWASIIGYIAPCMSAPIWEELLYRGFLLSGLTTWTGSYHISCIIQAVIFSAHHMSITAALPLFVLGYTWAVLYTQSKNLWTVIAVHAMWNSRVFLGSWLGL